MNMIELPQQRKSRIQKLVNLVMSQIQEDSGFSPQLMIKFSLSAQLDMSMVDLIIAAYAIGYNMGYESETDDVGTANMEIH